ncbi:Flp family type IVb pilin [Fulvimonas soli]|uniref:Pilus assembly protein Flp/PilA n=1 Tax=Fulvimonas soli TaxID=155197 RepID=A0A316I0I3_9GAMM|nr:Flp family type IVb pilin [Fulvimonas soli]PWK85845.1 pilus assembly protein Flp/PilA [Fulvimonas soli]TNY27249.1 pilin [Fulvimonas soli]
MNQSIRKFLAEEDGITAMEYGILAALVAVVLVAVIGTDASGTFGQILTALFNKVKTAVGA